MARRVFFSFHYERDNQRASVVRNSWVTKPDREDAGFTDAATWEKIEKEGEATVKRWINKQLEGTSVTAVLIGTETSSRKWVRYEIIKSYERGNGVFGITIHRIRDFRGYADTAGDLFFGEITKDSRGNSLYFYHLYPTHDWISDNGYRNLGAWVELAAARAGK